MSSYKSTTLMSFDGSENATDYRVAFSLASRFEQKNILAVKPAPQMLVLSPRSSLTIAKIRSSLHNKLSGTLIIIHFGEPIFTDKDTYLSQNVDHNTRLSINQIRKLAEEKEKWAFKIFVITKNRHYISTLKPSENIDCYFFSASPKKFIENFITLHRIKPNFRLIDILVFCGSQNPDYWRHVPSGKTYKSYVVRKERLWDRDIDQFGSHHAGSRQDGVDTLYQFRTNIELSEEAFDIARYFVSSDVDFNVRRAASQFINSGGNIEFSPPQILTRYERAKFQFLSNLIDVPAGHFRMGSDRSNDSNSILEEQPDHVVFVSDFAISKFQITVLDYQEYARETGTIMLANKKLPRNPVTMVNWYDAVGFTSWATIRTREIGALSEDEEIRLPSEAEWEKAARGDIGSRYPWGNVFFPSRCNYRETGNAGVVDVGSFSPHGDTSSGISDMAGNAWDWTLSLWGESFEEPDFWYPYIADDGRENVAAGDRVRRIIRGGGYYYFDYCLRTTTRNAAFPRFMHPGGGFRVVKAQVHRN